ncbi:hypothetical protein ACIRN4_23915 [Pimelobacter simplex]|uniref:hypothetical protein n=1 Tax=Nocardioides simplex TaxID=2045 RepID=UPI00381742A3
MSEFETRLLESIGELVAVLGEIRDEINDNRHETDNIVAALDGIGTAVLEGR